MSNVQTPHVTLVSTSLNPASRSSLLVCQAQKHLTAQGISSSMIDLRTLENFPYMGREGARNTPDAQTLNTELLRSTHVLFGCAVYNFDVSASAKAVMELCGDALVGKTVGVLCAAGGQRGYMSVMGFVNSLMLDFRCWIVPRFVYATYDDFSGDEIVSEQVLERITQLTQELFER